MKTVSLVIVFLSVMLLGLKAVSMLPPDVFKEPIFAAEDSGDSGGDDSGGDSGYSVFA